MHHHAIILNQDLVNTAVYSDTHCVLFEGVFQDKFQTPTKNIGLPCKSPQIAQFKYSRRKISEN